MNDSEMPTLDTEVLENVKNTMKDKFGEMVKYYLEDADSYFSVIKEGCENCDAEVAVRPAHTLKSSSFQMGAMKLGSIAEQMERSAKYAVENGGNIDELQGLLPSLDEELKAIRQSMAEMLK